MQVRKRRTAASGGEAREAEPQANESAKRTKKGSMGAHRRSNPGDGEVAGGGRSPAADGGGGEATAEVKR